ncbi:MAG: class II fructose-bisphosphatase [Bacilli bacterium]
MNIKPVTFEFMRVTECGAIAAYQSIGLCDKNLADQLAVKAMRIMLNDISIDGEIVIGEGEMDEAPMLYKGEKVGKSGLKIDIAVDPVDGTSNVSVGRGNSVSVLAAAEKGCLLKAPDMYMLKIAVGRKAANAVDISKSLTENIKEVAKALDKNINDIGVAMLERDRHLKFADEVRKIGAKLFYFPDGDVATAVQTCMPNSDIDIMYGYGGAPEGVIAAAALKALGGNFEGVLVHYDQMWPDDEESTDFTANEKKQLKELSVNVGDILKLDDLVIGEDFVFSCTGITKGDLVDGIYIDDGILYTETLLIRGKTQTIRKIKSGHLIEKKPDELRETFEYVKRQI